MTDAPDTRTTVGILASVTSGAMRQRRRRDAGAENGDLVVDDQFLGEPLGGVRRGRVILDDDLDLAARDGVAVLLEVKEGAVDGGLAGGVEGARHRLDQAELENLLGRYGSDRGGERHEARDSDGGIGLCLQQHGVPSPALT